MDAPKLTPEMMAAFSPVARAFIQLLLTNIAELEESLSRTSRNSSKLPSSEGPVVKPAPPKPATGKKPSGRTGHPKQSRAQIPAAGCRRVAPCFPASCRNCSRRLAGTDPKPLRFQVTRRPPETPEVTEYQRHRLDSACGLSSCGPLPAGETGQDGPRLRACAVLLTGRYWLTKENAASLMGDLFGVLQPVTDKIV